MNMRYRQLLIAALAATCLLDRARAFAQGANPPAAASQVPTVMRLPDPKRQPSIALAPAAVSLDAKFGQTVTQALTFSNETPNPFKYELVAEDVVVRGGSRSFVHAGDVAGSIAQSASFSEPSGTVAPNTSKTVEVRFTIPQQTDMRAVVAVFRAVVPPPSGSATVAIAGSLGALITFHITDEFRVEAEQVKAAVDSSTDTVTITSVLKNTGAEPVLPSGVAAILDARGRLVAKVPLEPKRLLPGERTEFKSEYAGQLPAGSYKILCSFEYASRQVSGSGTLKIE